MERKVWAPRVASIGKVKASRGVASGAADGIPLHAHSLPALGSHLFAEEAAASTPRAGSTRVRDRGGA